MGLCHVNVFRTGFDLGFPIGNASPTAHRDLTALVTACHHRGIRVFVDMVMAFSRDGSYEHIDADDFHIFDPANRQDDPDALTSTRGFGRKEVRNGFGSTLLRYAKVVDTYDPIDGGQRLLSPANRFMAAQLE